MNFESHRGAGGQTILQLPPDGFRRPSVGYGVAILVKNLCLQIAKQ